MGNSERASNPYKEVSQELTANLVRESSRRSFLGKLSRVGTITALVTSGVISVDTLEGNYIWGGTNPEIHILQDDEAKKKFPNTYTLAVGGYNFYDTPYLATSIKDAMGKYSQVASLRQSNEGLQINDIKRKTEQFVEENNATDMYLYGQSMGGMIAVELGAHLVQQGVRVNGIILDCSPMNYMDVRDVLRGGTNILVSTDEMNIHGGPNIRFVIEVLTRWQQGRRDVDRICEEALSKLAPENCSNKLIQSQASYMRQFDLNQFADAFTLATQFIHLRPDNLDADGTIDNARSHERLRTTLKNNLVIAQSVIGGGHANPGDCHEGYTAAILESANICDFYDGTTKYPVRFKTGNQI
jgi:pimeloyl-ACP methyl ester carboxylesterase